MPQDLLKSSCTPYHAPTSQGAYRLSSNSEAADAIRISQRSTSKASTIIMCFAEEPDNLRPSWCSESFEVWLKHVEASRDWCRLSTNSPLAARRHDSLKLQVLVIGPAGWNLRRQAMQSYKGSYKPFKSATLDYLEFD